MPRNDSAWRCEGELQIGIVRIMSMASWMVGGWPLLSTILRRQPSLGRHRPSGFRLANR